MLYRSLWTQTGVLSLTPINKEMTYADVDQLSMTLKNWYFADCGGLYLSAAAQVAYRNAQDVLNDSRREPRSDLVWRETEAADYERLRAAVSTLRTELTNDLQSRIAAPPEVAGRRDVELGAQPSSSWRGATAHPDPTV